jgi:hypothetical protein
MMDPVEKAVLEYLETRNNGWHWFMGNKCYTKKDTIERFKRDEAFRNLVKNQIYKLATEMFMRTAEKQ